jgi:hypothetical protein
MYRIAPQLKISVLQVAGFYFQKKLKLDEKGHLTWIGEHQSKIKR